MALVAEIVIAGAVLVVPQPARPAASPTAESPSAATLNVADGRTVRLLGTGPRTAALLNRVSGEIGAAVDAVDAFWGPDWTHDIVIVAAGTDAQFAVETGAPTLNWQGVAAVAVADSVEPAHRSAVRQRIVFAPGAAAMSTTSLRIVLRHELFHYAARVDTAADAPRWLTEGVADYVARPANSAPVPAAFPLRLPSEADLDASGEQRSAAYDRAWLFARLVADSYGAPALRRLYMRACGPGHPDVPTAVLETLGIGLPDLLVRWQR